MSKDFTKEFFQRSWGLEGYYEYFSYGVGIDKVCEICLYPFLNKTKSVLEIGSGGGVFTDKIIDRVRHLTAIDVIQKPAQFEKFMNFRYIELLSNSYDCPFIELCSIDFAFCYNTFCHLSNNALKEYLKSVNNVLKSGGDFVFMLSSFNKIKIEGSYKLGDLLPMGHFYQDDRTIDLITGKEWGIVSRNMIPDHRDIIVHLKKK